jgi:hypothetical protein
MVTDSKFGERFSLLKITFREPHLRKIFFSDEIESEEHLLLKCSFYYTSRRNLETIKNNINHSNFEKLSFGDKFIWLLNSESKDILICMCDFKHNKT